MRVIDQERTRPRRRVRLRWPLVAAALVIVGVLITSLRGEPDWQAVYQEDFGSDATASTFDQVYGGSVGTYPVGWTDTIGTGSYRGSESVTVSGGTAKIRVGNSGGLPVATALVPQLPTYGQVHGRYEVRFRADPVPGYKLAFLLWPDSERWPDDGEIDFPEGNLDGTIGAFAHHADPDGSQDVFTSEATFPAWHTAVVEWTPGQVRFLLDGKHLGTSTTAVPAISMHWVLQVETTSEVQAAAGSEGVVEVDYVRAWSYNG